MNIYLSPVKTVLRPDLDPVVFGYELRQLKEEPVTNDLNFSYPKYTVISTVTLTADQARIIREKLNTNDNDGDSSNAS
jgi:hypothetical protein